MIYRSDTWLRAKLKAAGECDDVEPLVHWAHAARHQRSVLFVGAGLSLTATSKDHSAERRMMTWAQLTRSLRTGLGDDEGTDDFLWIAERYRCRFGSFELHNRILDAVPDLHVDPSSSHHALRHVPWHTVLTLNYDTLLERALDGDGGRAVMSVTTESQLVRSTRHDCLPIIHLHGRIDQPETIVLTLEDYRRYSEDRAVFLTIARQLLLQHPVIFLGFGATDPNFVAWSGWIKDAVGDHSPPWVRLERSTGRQPDLATAAYWGTRLRTVQYGETHLPALFQCLGDAARPIRDTELLGYAAEVAELTRHIPRSSKGSFRASMEEAEKILREKDGVPLDFSAGHDRVQIVITMLHAGLQQLGATAAQIQRMTGRSREQEERIALASPSSHTKTDIDSLPTRDEIRDEIRAAMADNFLPWLLVAVRLVGRWIPVSTDRDTLFDAAGEYRRLRDADRSAESGALNELGLLTLAHELEKLDREAPHDFVETWLGASVIAALKDEDRRTIDDSLLRHRLRWGSIPASQESRDQQTAQGQRQKGFLEQLDAKHIEASQSYERASQLSRIENEPLIVQEETLRSALPGFFEKEQQQRMATTRERLSELRPRALSGLLDIAHATNEQCATMATYLRRQIEEVRAASPNVPSFSYRSDPLESVVAFYECYWLSPSVFANLAEVLGQSRWDQDRKASAIALLTRFGSEEAGRLVRADIRAPRGNPFDPLVIGELLRPPRWPHERWARLNALVEVASELDEEQQKQARALSIEGFDALKSCNHFFNCTRSFPAEPAIQLGLSLARYSDWPTFIEWVEAIRAIAGEQASLLSSRDWLHVPLRWWVKDSRCTPEALDTFFTFVIDINEKHPWGVRQESVFDVVTNLASDFPGCLLPNARCFSKMTAWLGDPTPIDDDHEWLRTACAVTLAAAQANDHAMAKADRKELLDALLEERLQTTNTWPNLSALQAWLWCRVQNEKDQGLIESLLRSAPETYPLGFGEHPSIEERTARRLHLKLLGETAEEVEPDVAIQLIKATLDRTPGSLEGFLETPLGKMHADTREVISAAVTACLIPHSGEDLTPRHHAALGCLNAAISHSQLEEVPQDWVYLAAVLTGSAYPEVAAYACRSLARLVLRYDDSWTSVDGQLLHSVRRALLHATDDGRAYVVAAARRALLDISAASNSASKLAFSDNKEVQKRELELAQDPRPAVKIAARPWVRERD